LIYRPGDFFVPHRDVDMAEPNSRPPIIRARRVNLIVALNAQSATPANGEYGDGDLTLYGLIDTPEWKKYGFPVPLAPGSLVAFRSEVIHEVAPIGHGQRYSIVSRMLDPSVDAPQPDAAGSRSERVQGPGSPGGRA
jgi:SM-20-related protein